MVVVGILLGPVKKLVSSLCVIDPAFAHKKRMDDRMGVLPFVIPRQNIVIWPNYVPGHSRPVGDWRCKRCSSDRFIVRSENRICAFCGESSYYEAESAIHLASSPSYRGFNDNASKRVTHFKNWLARLQGKERCSITAMELEMIRERVSLFPDSMSEFDRIRLAMRELGLQRFYNHTYYVMRHVFGYSLVEFRKINEARLLAMFMRIQEPFARITSTRTNMLSYQFLIKKFCELLGYKVAEFIPSLKSRTNLQQQDFMWSKICDELGLPYFPST